MSEKLSENDIYAAFAASVELRLICERIAHLNKEAGGAILAVTFPDERLRVEKNPAEIEKRWSDRIRIFIATTNTQPLTPLELRAKQRYMR